MVTRIILLLALAALDARAGVNSATSIARPATVQGSTNQTATSPFLSAQRAEQIRTRCIEGRRYVAGRVLQVLPQGIVVDSGYSQLLSPPLNRSWLVNRTVSVHRDTNAVEEQKADALCVGTVFISNIPKKPPVKPFDYVVMHAYPAGIFSYSPVEGIQKTVRRFSASLDRAVQLNLERESK
jgi:hypothetical protein